jgi:hypothetical protein
MIGVSQVACSLAHEPVEITRFGSRRVELICGRCSHRWQGPRLVTVNTATFESDLTLDELARYTL